MSKPLLYEHWCNCCAIDNGELEILPADGIIYLEKDHHTDEDGEPFVTIVIRSDSFVLEYEDIQVSRDGEEHEDYKRFADVRNHYNQLLQEK